MQSFHLYETVRGRHLFDFEDAAGQVFIKDNRLKAYEWTDTGIKLTITDINKNMDFGKYEGEVTIEGVYDKTIIEVNSIIGKSFVLIDLRIVIM